MSQHTRSSTPSSSSSSTLVASSLPIDLHLNPTTKPDLKLDIAPYSGWFFPEVDKRMSGKGFIEPHRNNLPRRKRRVVTAPVDCAAITHTNEKTLWQTLLPTSEAGPRSSTKELSASSSSSPSVDTNITEPPSSPRVSSTPSALHKPPALPNSPTTFLTYPTSFQRTPFHGRRLEDAPLRAPPPIAPTKGHLQPTSATVPRRRRSIAEQSRKVNDALNCQRISQTRPAAEADLVANSESQNMPRRRSICAQELSKDITLGFLAEEELDKNVVQIKVFNDSTIPLSSLHLPRTSSPSLSSSSELQLSLPTSSLTYTDGTTNLTDSQIQQACTFIDEHISISNNDITRPSVLILAPRMRPEEAMSIGVSYLAGMKDTDKREEIDDYDLDDDHTYSTVHRLLMSFHDDPGIPIPNNGMANVSSVGQCGIDTGSLKGLRPEWRGVLSFDGMQRLDRVWTSTRRS